MAEFEWPDNLAEDVWGDLPSRFSISDVEEVLKLVKPQVAGHIAALEKEVATMKRRVALYRKNNGDMFYGILENLIKFQEALAELAPDHELLQDIPLAGVIGT